MTDAPITNRRNQPPVAGGPDEAPATDSLGVLSLSSASTEQPEFDPGNALIAAATAEDGSVEEVVLLRLLVLRRAHPDAAVRTHLERVEGEQVVVRAEVTLSTGASASAYATADGGVASIERTEYRAIGRALDALGEAVLVDIAHKDNNSAAQQPANAVAEDEPETVLPDLDDWADDEPYPDTLAGEDDEPEAGTGQEPPEREIPPARFSSSSQHRSTATRSEPAPDRTTAPPPAVVDAVRRANLRRHAAGQPERQPARESFETEAPTDTGATIAPRAGSPRQSPPVSTPTAMRGASDDEAADEPPLENYSWTAFWRVARPLGLDKMKVEEIIGGPITPLTPLQVREKLRAAGIDI
ncbi:MAG: hypothetical protein QM589_07510 [Thermomicrobiales bacterium]